MKKLAVVWEDEKMRIAFSLGILTDKLFKKMTKEFGTPKGRTENFEQMANVELK